MAVGLGLGTLVFRNQSINTSLKPPRASGNDTRGVRSVRPSPFFGLLRRLDKVCSNTSARHEATRVFWKRLPRKHQEYANSRVATVLEIRVLMLATPPVILEEMTPA